MTEIKSLEADEEVIAKLQNKLNTFKNDNLALVSVSYHDEILRSLIFSKDVTILWNDNGE